MTTYRHTSDMPEISGFGGGYEKDCQDMLEAGVKWLTSNVERRELSASGLKGVYGIFEPDSEDAKALSAAVISAVEDCSGAQHHSVMARLFWIARNGWDKYVEEVRKQVTGVAS